MWHTQWDEQFLRQMVEETGLLPQALRDKPHLEPDALPYLAAYRMLANSRPISMAGAGLIPISEIAAYCTLAGILCKETRLGMARIISAVDITLFNDRTQRSAKSKTSA